MPGSSTFSIALAGCNFSCDFCQNWQISQATHELMEQSSALPVIRPIHIVQRARRTRCQSISYTYTEPIVFWEYALDCMQLAKEAGLANIAISNGFGSEAAWRAAAGLLDAANIDLKAFDQTFYKNQCNASLPKVLDSLRQLKEMGVWLEVTTLLIPGLNDNAAQLEKLATFIARELGPEVPWHVSAYRPAYKQNAPATTVGQLQKASDIARQAGLRFVYMGNVPHGADTACLSCGHTLIGRSHFQVLYNNISENGQCPKCGAPAQGRWQWTK